MSYEAWGDDSELLVPEGCVSQDDHDEVLAELSALRAQLAAARTVVADLDAAVESALSERR